jgi:hypothetical protein
MTYWRMQVHPGKSKNPFKDTVECISAGYIGLDFHKNKSVPHLFTVPKEKLPKDQQHYWAFAHEMKIGDRVLVFAHNIPLALVRVAGEYEYSTAPEIRVWFRHLRQIDDIRYYWDCPIDLKKWEHIPMAETIAPLRNPEADSFQLIKKWLGKK